MTEVLTQETSENLDRVTEHLVQLGLNTHGNLKERSDRLEAFYQEQHSARGIELAICDGCDRHSDGALHACPFCGDSEPVQPYPDGIIPTTPTKMKYSLYKVGHLDDAVESIRQSVKVAQSKVYEAAKTLQLIKEEQLWRFRLDEHGKLKYKDFYAFTRAELGISKSYACRIIRVVSEYNPSDIKRFGVNRLDVSLRLPEKRRPKFLNEAERISATGPELADLARQMNEQDETPGRPNAETVGNVEDVVNEYNQQKTHDSPPATEDEPAKSKVPTVKTKLVSMPLGISTLPMHKRSTDAAKYGAAVGAPTDPAKSISDMPWCRVWLDKTTVMYVRLGQNTTGEIEATLEIREGKEISTFDQSVLKFKHGRG
jgi:hypothetical protein